MEPAVFALHGLVLRLPAGWEPLRTRGDWSSGNAVFVDGRQPMLSAAWTRSRHQVDHRRTADRLARQAARDANARLMGCDPLPGREGSLIRLATEAGDLHALACRPDPGLGLDLILRQCQPGRAADLIAILDRVLVHGDDQPCPWRIHGLKADLPAWWRLHALEYVPGLARAVFFRWPGGGHRRDQVLVLRRYACATRLLAGATPEQWLTCRLDPGEEVRQRGTTPDGIAWADGLTRGDTLWRRLRRQRQHRRLHAWVETEEDRLVVQEWKGSGEPLPPLRSARSLNDVGLAGRSPPCERT